MHTVKHFVRFDHNNGSAHGGSDRDVINTESPTIKNVTSCSSRAVEVGVPIGAKPNKKSGGAGYAVVQFRSDADVEIVCLQKGNEKASVYCLPTSSGSVSSYLEVAAALAPDHAVFGIKTSQRARPGALKQFSSLREMAEVIAPELIAHRRKGPICLLGYSFAGHLAVQLAQHLEELGQDVPLLLIVDTMPSWSCFTRTFRVRHFMRYLGPWLLRIAARLMADRRHRSNYGRALGLRLRRQHRLERDNWFQDLTKERKEFVLNNLSHCYNYNFKGAYRGEILLFRPKDVAYQSPLRTGQLHDFGWRRVTGADVRVVHVPGDHVSCLQEANAAFLANELRLAFMRCGRAPAVVP
jgi:thioesterase domain-containing protein